MSCKITTICTVCHKTATVRPAIGICDAMYANGYRAVCDALYCPDCVKTWPERNGGDFDAQYPDSFRRWVKWWNAAVEKIAEPWRIHRYTRDGAGYYWNS